jgi:hypothetical protein
MQNFEAFRASFDDGVVEGDRFLALLAEITPSCLNQCNEYSAVEQLTPIFDYLIKRSQRYAYPYLEGFFSRVIKPTEFEAKIISLWGADDFIDNQSQYAPVCEFEDDFQIVQFGYATGYGDAWCIDLKHQEIICLSPGTDGSDDQSARYGKYGVFPAFDYLTAYLKTDAQRRGWLPR